MDRLETYLYQEKEKVWQEWSDEMGRREVPFKQRKRRESPGLKITTKKNPSGRNFRLGHITEGGPGLCICM